MPIATIDPATGVTAQVFAAESDATVDSKLDRARKAFLSWRRTTFAERAARMKRLAEILDEKREIFGRLMALEMGKPLQGGTAEAAKCATAARFYAEHAERFLADEPVDTGRSGADGWGRTFIRCEPLGVILAVMPWNFPFWQVIRFAAPALMAGNTGVLKHASNVPQCALALEQLFRDAEFPPDVFQTLLIGSDQVERVVADSRIAAVTLTGSEPAGSRVASEAGRQIKKAVLELGGSDPFIVMPSADLEKAVNTAIKARTVNSGQSCIAAKRFIVHEQVYEEFCSRFARGMADLKVGDPLDPATVIGPLATVDILDTLDDQVRRSVDAGARVMTGGQRLAKSGNFYPPTVLADFPREAAIAGEEFFGPVALVFKVGGIEEAIALANATEFGLGSSAWTQDAAERDRFIGEIEAGQVFINSMVASDPRVPFGGVKRSGFGRELSAAGIREFVNVKTAWIE